MAFSETWLTCCNNTLYNIDGYNVESSYRTMRRGGGVSLYIREHVTYTVRSDHDIFNDIMESKFVEIDKKCIDTDRNVIMGVIYRPPNSDEVQFTSLISGILQNIKAENKKIFLLGNYNIDLLNAEKHHAPEVWCLGKHVFIRIYSSDKQTNSRYRADSFFNW